MSKPHLVSDLKVSAPDIRIMPGAIRALFVAILTRALKDIFKPTYGDHEIYKSQALQWITVDDFESITSFINICNYLEIDMHNIRHTVNIEVGRIDRGLPHRIQFKREST